MMFLPPRRLQSLLMLLIVSVPLYACASRPESGYLAPVAESRSITAEHTILVATTRERDSRTGTLFNGERSGSLDYASITVSIPPIHKPGKVELASSAPGKPESAFVVREAGYLDGDAAFIQSLNTQLAERPPGKRRVLLFIHGYNTMFAEGLYRFAQVVHDSRSEAVPVLFTWASRGKLSEYVYDNNSATAARDNLEHALRLILASNAEEVSILAHSMGNWVAVEAYRQIKIAGNLESSSKIGSIFLAAPDIDLDVFKAQMRRIGRPQKPVYIVISKDDVALGVSRFIAGGQVRVGDANDEQELADLGVTVIDLTNLEGNDTTNHAKFAQLATVGPELGTVLGKGLGQSTAQRQQTAGGTLGAILGAPVQIISGQ